MAKVVPSVEDLQDARRHGYEESRDLMKYDPRSSYMALERESYRDGYLKGMMEKVDEGAISVSRARELMGYAVEEQEKSLKETLQAALGPDQVEKTEVRTVSSTGGEKGVKPQRYDLVPIRPLELLAILYGNGAEKYAAHNFRKGYEWSKSYAAAMRHLTLFWNGEDMDEEMGVPHVICAVFHLFALTCFMEEHPEHDDRYKPESNQPKTKSWQEMMLDMNRKAFEEAQAGGTPTFSPSALE